MVTDKEITAAFLTLRRLAKEAGLEDGVSNLSITFSPTYLHPESFEPRKQILFNGTKVGLLSLEKLSDAANVGLERVFPEEA